MAVRSGKSLKSITRRLPPAERKEQIVAAARRVFIRMGLNGARTRDIADEIGVTEATLYIYFKTKQELFQAAIVEPLQALIKLPSMKGVDFARAPSAQEKRKVCRAAVREIVTSMADVYPLLITAQFSDHESGTAVYNSDIYPILKEIGEAVNVGFSLADRRYAEFVAISTFGLSFSLVMHHHFTEAPLDIDEVTDKIAGLLLDGVSR
ncbi:TetR/AcrR family transcriptional regulator [Zhongshania marina]|uniref:TetR/AcrR family transcriptional regulator n=1 Tax=Zhongshania marina TaxID=2304603 RepID=A0ABX9W5T7_9GAMM|nr:TetR/AcrR family transcriptional regulator [Zhongshania marina]